MLSRNQFSSSKLHGAEKASLKIFVHQALKATLAGRRLCEKAIAAVMEHEKMLLNGISKDALSVATKVMQLIESNRQRED